MRTPKLIFIFTITIIIGSSTSNADVLVTNGGINSFKAAFIPGVMTLDVNTGAGQAGDYVLLTCGAFSNSSNNSFNAPSPAIFTELDTENCGANNNCIEGIWGGFTNNASSETLNCNTTGTSIIFNAVTLRYSNVDPMNPVIGSACSEGNGLVATAPSIATEAGSQVVRVFTAFTFTEDETSDITINPQNSSFDLQTSLEGSQISSIGTSSLFNSGGPTGTADQNYTGSARDWRACTIALRMEPAPPTPTPIPPTPTPIPPTPTPTPSSSPPPTDIPTPTPTLIPPPDVTSVPTLGQWGHLSIGIFAVLIGVWFLRRQRVKS